MVPRLMATLRPRKTSGTGESALHSPRWQAVYVHPTNPNVEVTVRSYAKPAKRRVFMVAGGPTLLHATSIARINNDNKESTTMGTKTRTRPKPRTKPAPEPEEELTLDDLGDDDLEGLDLDDIEIEGEEELALDDEVLTEDEEPEEELEEDEETDDESAEEEIDLGDDDIGDLLDESEIEEEPAPAPKAPPKAKAKPAPKASSNGLAALSDPQKKMLKAAVGNKSGAKVANIGQQRTADALKGRGLVKWASTDPKGGVVIGTSKGAKLVGADGVAYVAPAKTPAKAKAERQPASKPARSRSQAKSRGNGQVPKGKFGVAQIAKAVKVHEETVRRVIRLNEDRFTKDEATGRWLFSKTEAKAVIAEVKQYVKYTGGTKGRPPGAATTLPEGKVGPSHIADLADRSINTVYAFLRRNEERLGRLKNDDGLWVFTERQAQQIANKLGA